MDKLKLYTMIGYLNSIIFTIAVLLLVIFPKYNVGDMDKLLMIIIFICIPMIPIIFIFNAIKDKSILLKPIDEKRINEFGKLIKEHKSIATIKNRVSKWKNEGYNVEELEKMVKSLSKK